MSLPIVVSAVLALFLLTLFLRKSKEMVEYELDLANYVIAFLAGLVLFFLSGEAVLLAGYVLCMALASVVDWKVREIPDVLSITMFVIACLHVMTDITRYDLLADLIVYAITIAALLGLTLTGYVGGGDFKAYCSLALLLPGVQFFVSLLLIGIFAIFFNIWSTRENKKEVAIAPGMLVVFIIMAVCSAQGVTLPVYT